jgi:Pilus formation protein N terminal region
MNAFVKLLVPSAALALLVGAPEGHSEELLTLRPGLVTTVRVPHTVNGGFTGFVGDPQIADVYYGPKNVFMFVGKRIGTTNFIAIDNENGGELYRATLRVGVGKLVTVLSFDSKGRQPDRAYLCEKGCSEISLETPIALNTSGNAPRPEAPVPQSPAPQGPVPQSAPQAPAPPSGGY